MKHPLKILHLEDSPHDAELIELALMNGDLHCEFKVVASKDDFIKALQEQKFDIILSDYGIAGYDGLAALEAAQKSQPQVPFILVSGTLGEEEAVESLKTGATDYILKSRLTRLVPAVRRALEEARKRAELKETEARFLRAQRLESIGALASGIAHDLNNILAPIMMSAPMLRWGLKPEEVEKTLVSIESSARRGADLVKQLLLFGRGVEGDRTLLHLKHILRDMVRMVRETFPKAIELRARFAPDLWAITGDATQIHQVLLNLCVNARDAMPNGGVLTLSAENLHLNEDEAARFIETRPGPYVVIRVTDTGEGIAPEIREKIFDPFFTTKAPGKGTGLGLATVLGIAKSHGGFVDVVSEVGRGTAFSIYLPATLDESVPHNKETQPSVAVERGDGELILIVDDEPEILKVSGRNLETKGYRTLFAHDGVEALVLFSQRREEIDVVLTDLEMPLMDGVALVRAIRKIDPDVHILASSGIGNEEALQEKMAHLNALGVRTLLAKPYSANTLLQALHQILNGNNPQ
jgi:two-component system cell cycle sensor histidine kinase/response regulator CckA